MKNLINKHILNIQLEGGAEESEYIASEEYKEITNAIRTLSKHFESLSLSGYTKNKTSVQFSVFEDDNDNPALKGLDDKKRRKSVTVGASTCTNLAKLAFYLEENYGIKPKHISDSLGAAFTFFHDADEKSLDAARVVEKMKAAKNHEEAMDILKDFSPDTITKFIGDDNKTLGKEDLEEICDKLSESLDASIVLAISRFGEDEDEDDTCEVCVSLNRNLPKIAKKKGVAVSSLELAVAGGTATSLMEHCHKFYTLPKDFFKDYCDFNNL